MKNMDKIINTMEESERIYNQLLSISIEKKDIIIDGKVKELEDILKKENFLVGQINNFEDKREEAIKSLAEELNLPREKLTLSYICKEVKDHRCHALKEITERIGATLQELKEVNDLNGKLIEQSLEYIRFSINLITDSLESQDGVYEGKAESKKDKKASLFDAKV